ncbi:MAG: O-antigen ligase family protein, partial [Desulfobacterales bacterium]|nr:O-antigen ligase family protein [Desulfobacterales bacterium]
SYDNRVFATCCAIGLAVVATIISIHITYGNYKQLLLPTVFIVLFLLCLKDINRLLIIFIFFCVVSGNLELGVVAEVKDISIYPGDLFIVAISLLGFYRLAENWRSITQQEKLMLLFLSLIFFLFLLSILHGRDYQSAGVEFRSLLTYAATFSFIGFLSDRKRCLLLLKALFVAISVYCLLYISMYLWSGNPLRHFCPDYGSGYTALSRLSYSSKTVFIMFPFYISAIVISPRGLSRWIYISFILSFVVIILSLSRASWIIIFLSLPLQILVLKKKRAILLKRGNWILGALFFGSVFLLLFSFASPARFGIVKDRIESIFLMEKAGFGKYSTHELGALHSRYISYELILKEIKKRPIFGYGLGASIHRSSSEKFKDVFQKAVDSSYLVYLHKGGIILLFSFLEMICSILIKIARKAKNTDGPFEVFLSTSVFFALLNTMGLAIQDLVLYSGLQICTISLMFAIVVQWESIFDTPSERNSC